MASIKTDELRWRTLSIAVCRHERTYNVVSCSQNSVVSEIHGLKHSGGVMNGSYSQNCSKYEMQLQRHITTSTCSQMTSM